VQNIGGVRRINGDTSDGLLNCLFVDNHLFILTDVLIVTVFIGLAQQ